MLRLGLLMLLWLQWLPPLRPASQADGIKPDAPPAQEDSDDIEGMEQILEQLRGLGFSEGSSALDELSKKMVEAKARRAAAKPFWPQERDLRGKVTRKQQQISKLRERSEAAREKAKASLEEVQVLDQKVVEAAGEVGTLQKQLAEVARGVLLAAPCDGDATRLPPELQKLPKGLLDLPEWQAKLRSCEEVLASLVKQAQEAVADFEREAAEATSQAAAAAAAAQNVAQQHSQQGQQSAGAADDDEDMPGLGEQEVVDALGDLLPSSSAGDGDGDAAGRREAAKKLLHLMATRTVASRKPRKIGLKKDGSGG